MRIRVTVSIGMGDASDTFEIEDSEIEGMSEDEVNDYITETYGPVVIDNNVSCEWEVA